MRRPALVFALACAAALWAGCGGSSHTTPGRAVGNVDERRGAYRGIHLGMRSETVAVLVGAPLPRHDNPYLSPASAPPFLPADTPDDFVYPDVALTFVGDRVASITVYGQGAATTRGVGVGSSLAEVGALYAGVRCIPRRGGTQPEDPGCEVALGPRRYLYFSGDPIALITVSQLPPIP